jgi:hypothetical protein
MNTRSGFVTLVFPARAIASWPSLPLYHSGGLIGSFLEESHHFQRSRAPKRVVTAFLRRLYSSGNEGHIQRLHSESLFIQKALDMKSFIRLTAMAITLVASGANSADIAMRRVLTCTGPDAKIEIYIPETAWAGTGVENARLDAQVLGAYALDLSDAGKGKTLEPVHVQYSKDRTAVIIDQYTRKLPPTLVAVAGATVDFDQRFATGAKCGSFNQE